MTPSELDHLRGELAWVRQLAALAVQCERLLQANKQLDGECLRLAVRNNELSLALKNLGHLTETPPKLKLAEPDIGGES